MNIQTLNEYVKSFRAQVLDSGFRRDLRDYVASLPNNEGNIISLREVANSVYGVLIKIHASDLPEALQRMIPGASPPPFTTRGYETRLRELIEDKNIDQTAFFRSLRALLNELTDDVEGNHSAVEQVAEFIAPYVKRQQSQLATDNKATVSIIFRDAETTSGLHSFSRTLAAWDRTLPLYHQLITHSSPEAIQMVEVQNGSIDVVVNLNVDVAVNLAELFKYGLMAFGAYLAHKKLLLPIAKAYFDNKALTALDEQKEQMLLAHVGEVVAGQAKKQFERLPHGKEHVDNPHKIIESIKNLVTAHIVRGNEYKILALPEKSKDGTPPGNLDPENEKRQLAEATADARAALTELPESTTTMLLQQYGSYRDEPEVHTASETGHKTRAKKGSKDD